MKDSVYKKSEISPLIFLLSIIPPPLSFILYPSSFILLTFLGLMLCANLFLSGCHRTSGNLPDIQFEYKIAPDPPKTGLATVTLKLADSAGKPISGARISLEGNMTHAGMRPVFSEAREVETGRYEAALELTMRGDWIVLVHLSLPDGRKMEKQIALNEVRSG